MLLTILAGFFWIVLSEIPAFAQRPLAICVMREHDTLRYLEPLAFIQPDKPLEQALWFPQVKNNVWRLSFPVGVWYDLFQNQKKLGDFFVREFRDNAAEPCRGPEVYGNFLLDEPIDPEASVLAFRAGEFAREAPLNWGRLDTTGFFAEASQEICLLLERQGVAPGVTTQTLLRQFLGFQIKPTAYFIASYVFYPKNDSQSYLGALLAARLVRSKKGNRYEPILCRVSQSPEKKSAESWEILGLFDLDQDSLPELFTRKWGYGTYSYEIYQLAKGQYQLIYHGAPRGCE